MTKIYLYILILLPSAAFAQRESGGFGNFQPHYSCQQINPSNPYEALTVMTTLQDSCELLLKMNNPRAELYNKLMRRNENINCHGHCEVYDNLNNQDQFSISQSGLNYTAEFKDKNQTYHFRCERLKDKGVLRQKCSTM